MCSGLPLRLWAAAPLATLKGGSWLALPAEGGLGSGVVGGVPFSASGALALQTPGRRGRRSVLCEEWSDDPANTGGVIDGRLCAEVADEALGG
jgi:hypothetical protein